MKEVKLTHRATFRNWKESNSGKSLIAYNEASKAGTITRDNVTVHVEHDTPENTMILSQLENGNIMLFGRRQGIQFQEVTLVPKKQGMPTKKEGVTSDFFRATKRLSATTQRVYKLNKYSNSSACVLEINEEAVSAQNQGEASTEGEASV